MKPVEIFAVTLLVILLFQALQGPLKKQEQPSEPLPLITAPEEPPPSHERVRLLLEESQPEDAGTAIALEIVPPTLLTHAPEIAIQPEVIPAEMAEVIPFRTVKPNAPESLPAPVEPPQPTAEAVPQNPCRSSSRRDQVWALLDQAAVEGVEGYTALMAYVKDKSGQGTSRSTIKAWKEARSGMVACG